MIIKNMMIMKKKTMRNMKIINEKIGIFFNINFKFN